MEKPLINPPDSGDIAATLIVGILVGGIGYIQGWPLVEYIGGGIVAFSLLFILGPAWCGGLSVIRSWRTSPFARRLTLSAVLPASIYAVVQAMQREFLQAEAHFMLLMLSMVWVGGLVVWAGVEIIGHIEEAAARNKAAEAPPPVTAVPVAVSQPAANAPELPVPQVHDPAGEKLPEVELDPVWFKDPDWLRELMLRMPRD